MNGMDEFDNLTACDTCTMADCENCQYDEENIQRFNDLENRNSNSKTYKVRMLSISELVTLAKLAIRDKTSDKYTLSDIEMYIQDCSDDSMKERLKARNKVETYCSDDIDLSSHLVEVYSVNGKPLPPNILADRLSSTPSKLSNRHTKTVPKHQKVSTKHTKATSSSDKGLLSPVTTIFNNNITLLNKLSDASLLNLASKVLSADDGNPKYKSNTEKIVSSNLIYSKTGRIILEAYCRFSNKLSSYL